MSLEVTGKLLVKSDAQQVSEKFKKREFVIEIAEEINGNNYTNFGKFQLVQAKCEILDRFNIGNMVKVHFNIKGNSYVDKKDGVTKYISNLDAWRIEAAQAQQAAPQQPKNENIPIYSSSHTTNGGSGYASAPQQAPLSFDNGSANPIDDLPF